MKAKMVIPITLTFFIVMIIIPSVSAQSTIASIMGTVSNAQYNYATQAFEVPYGQMIELKVTVSVASDSPVPLDGFWICVGFIKPNGIGTGRTFDFTKEYIGIGQSKSYILKTGIVADVIGEWSYVVTLKTKDGERLDACSGSFYVVSPTTPTPTPTPTTPTPTPTPMPKVTIRVEDVMGYVAMAGLGALAAYLVLKRLS